MKYIVRLIVMKIKSEERMVKSYKRLLAFIDKLSPKKKQRSQADAKKINKKIIHCELAIKEYKKALNNLKKYTWKT